MLFLGNPLLRRTLSMVLLGAMALLTIVAVSMWLSLRTSTQANAVAEARKLRSASADLLSLMQDAESGQRGYLLTRDTKYLAPHEEATAKLPEVLNNFKTLLGWTTPETFRRISTLAEQKNRELAETIALQNAGDAAAALQVVATDRGKIHMDQLREILGDQITKSDKQIESHFEEMRTSTSALRWVTMAAGLLVLGAAAMAGRTVTGYTRDLLAAQVKVEEANASLEERVKQRTSDLSRANEEIQRFAYIVSHDLRAPLVNILGFTSEMEASLKSIRKYMEHPDGSPMETGLLEEAKLAADTDMPEALRFIRTSSQKMDKLINAILTLSRQGRRELRPEHIDLTDLVTAASASVQHQLDERGGAFVVRGRLPTLNSDRLALEQIFGNLVDNAIKYSSAGRPIRIEVTGSEQYGWVTVDFADNGRGIARDDHERIFDLFRRAGVQDTAGEGIGLAHVRALVRRLGGNITVESELGKGSTFTIILPKTHTPSQV